MNVIKISLSDASVVHRLLDRYVCQNVDCQSVYSLKENSELVPKQGLVCDKCNTSLIKRADDAKDTVLDRIQTYHMHADGLINYYKTTGYQVHEIDGDRSLHDVFEDFKKVMCVS